MRMNIIIFLFSVGALLLASCGALRTDETAAVDIEDPTPDEMPVATNTPPDTVAVSSQSPDSQVSSDTSNTFTTQIPAPYLPQAGDEAMNRSQVFIDTADLMILESYPPQFRLHIAGNLPDPCHQLRVDIRPPIPANA